MDGHGNLLLAQVHLIIPKDQQIIFKDLHKSVLPALPNS